MKKLLALALTEASITEVNETEYVMYGKDYLVLTEEEREEKIKEYVEQSVWAFNASFLSEMTELPEEVFTALQPQCEGANEAMLSIIEKTCGLDEFINAAVDADGYGHFLSSYDGEELEETVDGTTYYIYRTN